MSNMKEVAATVLVNDIRTNSGSDSLVLKSTSSNGNPTTYIRSCHRSSKYISNHEDSKKIFVGSWNVGGIEPPDDLNIEDWINTGNDLADIYVLGFQEIVPLNSRNVLGITIDSKISMKWNSLIDAALNRKAQRKPVEEKIGEPQKVYPVKASLVQDSTDNPQNFQCITSKQMVGIFITVWVRNEILPLIQHLNMSCVGCGILGCFGNKGSVSVRFLLNHTSFCFVCTHLASGGKEGDQRHRNTDAIDILSRTRFTASDPLLELPQRILDHDRVVWLGDLNYRIYLSDSATRSLVKNREWKVLLENDQLKVELSKGHVFEGWKEGLIEFPPTYKYHPNSGDYFGFDQNIKGKKNRAPAWCDRIIWFGEGLTQNQYCRGESMFSDHRPVWAMFTTNI